MPTYEYLCEKCGHEFEREQRITEPPIRTCPECRSRKVKKLISQTSFVLKGGGWYADLYSSAQRGNKKESTSEPPSTTTDSSAASESKKSSRAETESSSSKKKTAA